MQGSRVIIPTIRTPALDTTGDVAMLASAVERNGARRFVGITQPAASRASCPPRSASRAGHHLRAGRS
jgi:hypothetical protein